MYSLKPEARGVLFVADRLEAEPELIGVAVASLKRVEVVVAQGLLDRRVGIVRLTGLELADPPSEFASVRASSTPGPAARP